MPTVEVVWAGPDQQWLVRLEVAPGTTLIGAVRQSGLLERLGERAPQALKLGIFGRPSAPDALVEEGDRVEIYRELVADPKDARRRRAKSAIPSSPRKRGSRSTPI